MTYMNVVLFFRWNQGFGSPWQRWSWFPFRTEMEFYE